MKDVGKIVAEVIEAIATAAIFGSITYFLRGHPWWIGMTVLGFGFAAYRNGLLNRIGLREDD